MPTSPSASPTADVILVLNAGSSSLKFGVFDLEARHRLLQGTVDWTGGDRNHAQLTVREPDGSENTSTGSIAGEDGAAGYVADVVQARHRIVLVGHRVVHGGTSLRESTRIDDDVVETIHRLGSLAPLHNPPALAAIRATRHRLPGVPQVAAFDTAFFAELPPAAFVYPLPYEWYAEWGIRRFGFHGLSHAYAARQATGLLPRSSPKLRLVSCHLGSGCSATAIHGGRPVQTTMGFTPLEGLMMGTRAGSIDPGILLHVQREHGVGLDELDRALNQQSGLRGISGFTARISEIEAAAAQGHERARLAFTMFTDRVRGTIGGLAALMGGVDAVIFTARIGETMPGVRAAICQGLQCLGLHLDPDRNASLAEDGDIAREESPARLLVIRTQEELMIAQEARRVAGLP